METKKCNTCNTIKPLKDFHKSRTNKDGHISQCKECKAAAIRLCLFKAGKRRTPDLIKQFEEPIDPNRTHKICYVCEKSKPLDDFYKESRTIDGYQTRCKTCQRSSAQISYAENKPRVLSRNKKKYSSEARRERTLKESYGIDLKDYNNMLEDQEGKCGICGGSDPKHTSGRFVVDHCHESGLVRGLLCGECNFMIGKSNDDIEILKKAITYLKNSKKD